MGGDGVGGDDDVCGEAGVGGDGGIFSVMGYGHV